MSATNNPSFFGRIKDGAHSLIALAFLLIPLLMTGLFLYNTVSASLTSWSERTPNHQIADCKVTSRGAVLFDEPVVSLTFDDGWRSVAEIGAPILCEYGVASTQYILTGVMTDPAYMSAAQVIALHDAGHEIASHTVSHADALAVSEKDMIRELKQSKASLVKLGVTDERSASFAYPYGSRSDYTDSIAVDYYSSLRGTRGGKFDSKHMNVRDTFRPPHIVSYTVENSIHEDDVRSIMKAVKDTNAWLVLAFHQVDESGQQYAVTNEQLTMILEIIREENIKTMTIRDALNSYRGDA